MKKQIRKLKLNKETVRTLQEGELRLVGAAMFPLSNAYPTQCLAGTGCGNLSGACA